MKKLVIVFGILAALFVLFAISSSAAVITENPFPMLSIPFSQNIAQPQWGLGYNGDLAFYEQYVPSDPSRSALGVALPFGTPTGDTVAISSRVNWSSSPSWSDRTEMCVNAGDGLFGQFVGDAGSNNLASFGYLHIALDLGASSGTYSTSYIWLSQFFVRLTYADDPPFEYIFYRNGDISRMLYCDIPLSLDSLFPTGVSIWLSAPSNYSVSYLESTTLTFNNMWIYLDNSASPTLDLVHSQNGYTSAYLNYYSLVPLGDVGLSDETSYYYDLGYSQGFDVGDRNGYNRGYDAGVDSVTEQTGDPVSIKTAIFAVPNALVHLLRSLFNFEIAGFNLFDAFKFLISLLAVAVVARLVLRSMT